MIVNKISFSIRLAIYLTFCFNEEAAAQDHKLTQDLYLESLAISGEPSTQGNASPFVSGDGSKDGVTEPSLSAVSLNNQEQEKQEHSPTNTFTVLEAIALTLNYQREIQIRNQDIAIQSGLLRQAAGPFDYYMNTNGTETYIKDSLQYCCPWERERSKAFISKADTNLTKKNRLGTEFAFSAEVAHVHAVAKPRINGGDASVGQVSFLLNQPLLRNFRYGLDTMNEQAQRFDVSSAWYMAAYFVSSSITGTTSRYWEVVATRKLIEIQLQAKKIYEDLAERTKKLIVGQIVAANDLNQIIAQIAQTDINLILSQQQHYISVQKLKFAMGVGDQCGVDDATDEFPPIQEGLFQDNCAILMKTIQRLSQNRLDIVASQMTEEAIALRLKGSQNNSLPQLDVFGKVTIGATPSQIQSPGSTFVHNFHEVNVMSGVAFSTPLFNDAALGLVQQRRAEWNQQKLVTERLKEQVAVQFFEAWKTHFYLINQLRESNQAIETNQLIVNNEIKKLNAGYSSIFFVLDFQNQLISSLIQRIEIYKQYAQNIVQFRFAAGLLVTLDSNSNEFKVESVTQWPDPFK